MSMGAGDEDAGRDNGRVHGLLAAVLHPRPSQTVLPPVRRRRRHTRLAHQVRAGYGSLALDTSRVILRRL